MKGRNFIIAVSVGLVLSGCHKAAPVVSPVYSVVETQYQHNYGEAVHVISSGNEFVICDSCTHPSKLERVSRPVPISIRMTSSTPASSPSSSAGLLATPGKPASPVPGNLSSSPVASAPSGCTVSSSAIIAPLSLPSTTPVVQSRLEIKSTGLSSLPVSTTTSVPTSTIAAQVKISATPLADMPSRTLTTVYFSLNSSALAHAELQKITDSLGSYKGKIVVVAGFTCRFGSKKINDPLALERAKSVAAVLEHSGIKPVMVSGEGKCCYISGDQSLNRRVEIRITGNVQ